MTCSPRPLVDDRGHEDSSTALRPLSVADRYRAARNGATPGTRPPGAPGDTPSATQGADGIVGVDAERAAAVGDDVAVRREARRSRSAAPRRAGGTQHQERAPPRTRQRGGHRGRVERVGARQPVGELGTGHRLQLGAIAQVVGRRAGPIAATCASAAPGERPTAPRPQARPAGRGPGCRPGRCVTRPAPSSSCAGAATCWPRSGRSPPARCSTDRWPWDNTSSSSSRRPDDIALPTTASPSKSLSLLYLDATASRYTACSRIQITY